MYSDKESGRQPLLLGLPEVEYLQGKAAEICRAHPSDHKAAREEAKNFFGDNKKNFETMREALSAKSAKLPKGRHAGIEGALFGRMVTSDPAANIEAAVHVAHTFTVHRQESENDFFSAVEDLREEDEDPGAAFIGDTELTAGLFYGYVVVDVRGLVSNLEGCEPANWKDADRETAAKVVEHLVHLIATVSPGAKLGSTAPYGYADLMLVEAGSRQPRSLANAFRNPVSAQVDAAMDAMDSHLDKLDEAYGANEARRMTAVEPGALPGAERVNLDGLAAWAADAVRNGAAA